MIILKSSSGPSDTDYFLCEVIAIITLILVYNAEATRK